jgi:hypothetical protein
MNKDESNNLVISNFDKSEQNLRIYCSRHLKKLFNPFNKDIQRDFTQEEVDLSLDFLAHVLKKEVDEPRLQEIDQKFYSAFEQYLTTSRFFLGSVLNGIERLSALFEPFLKKAVYIYFKAREWPGKNAPLWHAGIDQILKALGFIKANIKNDKDDYWAKQSYEQAIFRLEYVTRHKGVHESHFYTLEEVEKIANSIVASYLLASFFLVSNEEIKKDFLSIKELRDLTDLLRSKTASYASTGSLLTPKEHIKIYKYRDRIAVAEDSLRFLFINYLAGNGPIFFWIKDVRKTRLTDWARELLKSPNEDIKRNAVRFLILLGEPFSLSYLKPLFFEYKLQSEYATYISEYGTSKDLDLLLALSKRSKFEEVRSAAIDACINFLTMKHINRLERMACSTNIISRLLFEKVVLKNATNKCLKKYRVGIANRKIYKRLIAAYSLGMVGVKEDLQKIKIEFKKRKLNRYLKEALLKSIVRLSFKYSDEDTIFKYINYKSQFIAKTAIFALPQDFIEKHLKKLMDIYNKHPNEVASKLYEFSKKEFIESIKEILSKQVLDNRARLLVLALCKVGDHDIYEFLMKLFMEYSDEITFWNPVYIGKSMSRIASEKNKSLLIKIISLKEFWRYYGKDGPTKDRIPVKNYNNVYFIKRITGITYPVIANYSDLNILKKMLSHAYELTALSAAKSIGVLAQKKDIISIVEAALKEENDFILRNFVTCLCEIDRNIYYH